MANAPIDGSDIWQAIQAIRMAGSPPAGGQPFTSANQQVSTDPGGPSGPPSGSSAGMFNAGGNGQPFGPAGNPTGPNAGQTDSYGNVYYPVNNSLWNGAYIDPQSFPGRSTGNNSQLWGGPTSDSAPAWLKGIVADALAMPDGPAKTARIQHIMSSLVDPQAGANSHDLGYAERAFGISGKNANGSQG